MNRPSTVLWRPATTFILIGGLTLLLIALVVSYVVTNFKPTTEFRIGGGVYHLWVADTEASRTQGLSGVTKLPGNGGLLMKFDADGYWPIWMKDMEVPLDILWLNNDKRVVHIVKNAQPSLSTSVTFIPKEQARYVIELPAGSVQNASISVGGRATFDETVTGASW